MEGKLSEANPVKYRWNITIEENLRVYNHNTLLKDGEAVVINNINAVSTGSIEGITTTVLKVRETPGVSGKEKSFSCDYSDGENVSYKSLDKGKILKIFARTKDKDTVGKWNNYWYYVRFDIADNSNNDCYGDEGVGWVFGEFVKLK